MQPFLDKVNKPKFLDKIIEKIEKNREKKKKTKEQKLIDYVNSKKRCK